ncbi:MAG: hypothetical protein ABIQ35_13700 [Verrucomicrobiota bacterium]
MNENNSRIQLLTTASSLAILLLAFVLTGHTQPAPGQLERIGDSAGVATPEPELRRQILFQMHINPEMRVKVTTGPASPTLVQNEWRTFLVRIENESGTMAPLQITVLNPTDARSGTNAWLQAEVVADTALPATLSGRSLEYRVVRLRSLVAGKREGQISLHVGQGTQDIGFRNEVDILFQCQPARTNSSTMQP